jgi:hypothetical protein
MAYNNLHSTTVHAVISKGEGTGWVGLHGKGGIGVWPTQKLSRGAPYDDRM